MSMSKDRTALPSHHKGVKADYNEHVSDEIDALYDLGTFGGTHENLVRNVISPAASLIYRSLSRGSSGVGSEG